MNVRARCQHTDSNEYPKVDLLIATIFRVCFILLLIVSSKISAQQLTPSSLSERISHAANIGIEYRIHLPSQVIGSETGVANNVLGRQHVLVQFWDIPSREEWVELEQAGIHFQSSLHHSTYFVLLDLQKTSAREAKNIPLIRWIGCLQPEDKIQPELLGSGDYQVAPYKDDNLLVDVTFHPDVRPKDMVGVIESLGGHTVDFNSQLISADESPLKCPGSAGNGQPAVSVSECGRSFL